MKKRFRTVFIFLMLSASCAAPGMRLAQTDGFIYEEIETNPFRLAALVKITDAGEPLRIYIEGDGFAWQNPYTPSGDPTPMSGFVVDLAKKDPSPNVAYLARPCQYVRSKPCEAKYWTDARFAREVVDSAAEAVYRLKRKAEAPSVELVGFSGGGTLASLLAVQIPETKRLVTIAGILDTAAWTKHHRDSPLKDSLNPADLKEKLQTVPQVHIVGKLDRTIPAILTKRFLDSYTDRSNTRLLMIEDASHFKGFEVLDIDQLVLP